MQNAKIKLENDNPKCKTEMELDTAPTSLLIFNFALSFWVWHFDF
jgi:hypothetical protein